VPVEAALPGVAVEAAGARAEFDVVIDTVLATATLDRPTSGALAGVRGRYGRDGLHTEEFGYVLARPWWGQGLMTEALTEIVQWGLAQPAIFRIGAVCDVENVGSARVMEKSGLVREGLLRRYLIHPNMGNEPRDCYSYAKVR